MNALTRYNRAMTVLHWLLAVLILLMLGVGTLSLKEIPNSSPEKLVALRGHMVAGIAILLLTLARIVVRWRSAKPPAARSGNAALDRLAVAVHHSLYLLVLVMAASGIALAVTAGLPAIVFGGTGSLPESFAAFAPRAVHGIVAKLLLALVALHIAGALYHQFFLKDRLLARMGLGRP